MFTGIVEEIGSVLDLNLLGDGSLITIGAEKILLDVKPGDSISVNGVCLTVQTFTPRSFKAHLSSETTSLTTFGELKKGASVNMERALKMGDRLGGHMLSGHVDGMGEVTGIDSSEGWFFHIKIPVGLVRYIIHKGSVAVNGISLTVAKISGQGFCVAVVPHTLKYTTLKTLKRGDKVNVECDMLGKYVEKFVSPEESEKPSGLTAAFLEKHGF